jgi:hypothetical protein
MSSDGLKKKSTGVKYYDLILQYLCIGVQTQFGKDREVPMRTRMLFLQSMTRAADRVPSPLDELLTRPFKIGLL